MTTLAQVMVAYLQHASVLKSTARHNCLALLRMFREARGLDRSENIPLNSLTAELVADFQMRLVERYCKEVPPDDASQREARDRSYRTSRSTIRQARSLFARRGDVDLIAVYKTAGFELPDCLQDFISAPMRGRSIKTDYNVPPDSLIESTFERIELMRGDPDLYVAFWLCAGAGLRRTEAHRCQWEYIIEVDGKPRVCGGCGKGGEKINVPIQSKAFSCIAPFRRQSGFIIQDRGDEWARRLSAWMRRLGWGTRLTLHELRAYCGSLIYKRNPRSAMLFLRHRSIVTTERHYLRYRLDSEIVDVL